MQKMQKIEKELESKPRAMIPMQESALNESTTVPLIDLE